MRKDDAKITVALLVCITVLSCVAGVLIYRDSLNKRSTLTMCLASGRSARECHLAVYGGDR